MLRDNCDCININISLHIGFPAWSISSEKSTLPIIHSAQSCRIKVGNLSPFCMDGRLKSGQRGANERTVTREKTWKLRGINVQILTFIQCHFHVLFFYVPVPCRHYFISSIRLSLPSTWKKYPTLLSSLHLALWRKRYRLAEYATVAKRFFLVTPHHPDSNNLSIHFPDQRLFVIHRSCAYCH